jgi:hypothetical protein
VPVLSSRERRRRVGVGLGLAIVSIGLAACGASHPKAGPPTTARVKPPTSVTTNPPPAVAGAQHRMFAFYYLWWDTQHWHARLGTAYPYGDSPLPLPATLGASGCDVRSSYPGDQLTDVPDTLWTQADPRQILTDVTNAARAGLAGFAVAWAGTGEPHQTAASSAFNTRLAMLVSAVHQVDRSGLHFSLWIAYMSSARIRTLSEIDNDLAYLQATYAHDPAFDRTNSANPTLIMMGSRKYPQSVLDTVSAHWRPHFYLVGDENWSTWNSAKAADFDADQYYWSSQNPIDNPRSFALIAKLAAEVRSSRNPDGRAKKFFAPLAPGYDKVLGGGSGCVPRDNGETMRALYMGNSRVDPDGWMVISWNEIDEGTYIMPLERYGDQTLTTLHSIIDGSNSGGAT